MPLPIRDNVDKAIGGIPLQGITEVAGEAGCGKTQLCLMLSLQVRSKDMVWIATILTAGLHRP